MQRKQQRVFSKIVVTEISINDYNAIVHKSFKLFQPEDDPLWLKHISETCALDNILVLTALYSFTLQRKFIYNI